MTDLSFAVRRSDLVQRADVRYAMRLAPYRLRYSKPVYPLVPLGELTSVVQYGSSALASTEGPGLPIVRMNNLQDDGWDLRNLKYVVLPPNEIERYRLRPGDILINRTNGSPSLIGKCEVWREEGDWLFASYLMRIRVDERRVLPDFVATFLNTSAGRLQVERLSRQILMLNINAQEVRSLLIPLPPLDVQERAVEQITSARKTRERAGEKAQLLLERAGQIVSQSLGLQPLPTTPFVTWAATRAYIQTVGRGSANYFHPERIAAIRAIGQADKATADPTQLGSLVRPRRQIVSRDTASTYIGLASVESNTGRLLGGRCCVSDSSLIR